MHLPSPIFHLSFAHPSWAKESLEWGGPVSRYRPLWAGVSPFELDSHVWVGWPRFGRHVPLPLRTQQLAFSTLLFIPCTPDESRRLPYSQDTLCLPQTSTDHREAIKKPERWP